MTDEPHFVAEAMARDEADQLLAIGVASGRIAGEDDHRVVKRAFLIGERRRGDQVALPLDAGEPRRMQHDLGARRDAPLSSEALDRAGTDGGRIERRCGRRRDR